MFNTYKATLTGKHIEWQGEAPDFLEKENPVDVLSLFSKNQI
ncbi:MAG: hypothetical protein AB1757_11215 [Acidobacteriota bacterium]